MDHGESTHRSPLVQRAKTFMIENVLEPLSIVDVARAMSVTPRALQLAFSNAENCSPMRWLRDLRLDGARSELLRQCIAGDEVSISSLSTRWQIPSASRFARYYRERFGENPSETISNTVLRDEDSLDRSVA